MSTFHSADAYLITIDAPAITALGPGRRESRYSAFRCVAHAFNGQLNAL